MTRISLVTALSISLLCLSSSLTGQKSDKTEKESEASKPVVIVTRQNLPTVIDSLKQPHIEQQQDWKAKIDSIQKLSERDKKLASSQKKNKTQVKVIYRNRVVVDTVYVKKESLFKRIGKIFKSKKKQENG